MIGFRGREGSVILNVPVTALPALPGERGFGHFPVYDIRGPVWDNFVPLGLGFDYYDILNQLGGLKTCDPKDSACVSYNQQLQIAAEDAWSNYLSNPATASAPTPDVTANIDTSPQAVAQFMLNQPVTDTTVTLPGQAPQTIAQIQQTSPFYTGGTTQPAAPVYHPSVQFTNSRGGSTVYPGDTWSIKITGGAPGSPVTVKGGIGGAQTTSTMGTTDANGAWSTSGTFDASQLGVWSEAWSVGGTAAGSFTFTVANAPAGTTTGGGTTGGGTTGGGTTGGTGGGGGFTLPTIGGFDLSSIPWWGWAGAAAVGLFMFTGGGGRR